MRNPSPNAVAATGNRRPPLADAAGASGTLRRGPWPVGATCSARANSAALGKRSAATGASALLTAWPTCSGTLGRACETSGAGALSRFTMSACIVGAVNGGSPASISYNTQPRL